MTRSFASGVPSVSCSEAARAVIGVLQTGAGASTHPPPSMHCWQRPHVLTLPPVQTPPAHASPVLQGLPSLQAVPSGWKPLAGHVEAVPVQVAATSHDPDAA